MKTNTGFLNYISLIVKKALEGRMSPFNFLIMLGFVSSLFLLYISLHVHFFDLSSKIDERRRRIEKLRDRKTHLTAEYNKLTSRTRIIPIVQDLGLRAGSPAEIKRLAYYENHEQFDRDAARWAQVTAEDNRRNVPSGGAEN